MDFEVIRSYLPLYEKALFLTMRIGWQGILLAAFLGLFSAAIIRFRIPFLTGLIRAYIGIFRNTPLLVQLFFICRRRDFP